MAITYSAGTGTLITTHIFNETLGNQSQQTGNNTVIVSDTIGNAGNGQEGDGTNGIGDSFVGRLIIIDLGLSTEQRRMCITDTAGTTTTRILTVHEDWDTNPVITTDTIHVPYEPADIEDGTASGGISFNSRTGLFECTNILTVQNTGGLQVMRGTALEIDDRGSTISFIINSGGYLYMGYEAGGAYIDGGLVVFYNNATGEQGFQAQSGSLGYIYDSLWWSQLIAMQWEHANGAGLEFYGTKLLNNTDETHLFDMFIRDCKVSGKGATTEIVRVDAGTDCNGLVLSNVDTLETASGDTTTETIELTGVVFSSVTDLITLVNNKTYNMIDPVWTATTSSDFNDTAVSGSATINDRTSVTAVVQEADGTLLQDALVNVYENTQLADLVLELTTDVNGEAGDSFLYLAHVWTTGTGATTTYGGHARQCGKWLYLPLVFAQSSTDKFNGVITLSPDTNIVQTTQATALTDGSGITWSEPANPTEIVDFTSGSGTLAVGMILTFSPSTAVGTLRESASGDSTAGELYLDTRDSTAIANGDTFSRTGGTAGTFSGTYTNDSKQPFTISINGNSKSLQTDYDYLAAKQNETTLSADGELIWEWCRSDQTQPLYITGSSFYTERSNGKGIYIYNRGAGTVGYFTDDSGTTWTPPTSVTLTLTLINKSTSLPIANARGAIYLDADDTELMNGDSNASGIVTAAYTYTGNVDIYWRARESPDGGDRYFPDSGVGEITASGYTNTVSLRPLTIS